MTALLDPLLLESYAHLPTQELQALIETMIEAPDREMSESWQRLKQAVAHAALIEMRPGKETGADTVEWPRWLAMVLRFVEPLVKEDYSSRKRKQKPISRIVKALLDEETALLEWLAFGNEAQQYQALRTAFDAAIHLEPLPLSSEQDRLLSRIQCRIRNYEDHEKMVSDWSLDGKGWLVHTVVKQFATFPLPSAQPAIEPNEISFPKYVTEYDGVFADYLSRMPPLYYSQVVAYQSEYQERIRSRQQQLPKARLAIQSFALTVLGLWLLGTWIPINREVAWIVLVMISVICGMVLMLFVYHHLDTVRWTRGAVRTLEHLSTRPR